MNKSKWQQNITKPVFAIPPPSRLKRHFIDLKEQNVNQQKDNSMVIDGIIKDLRAIKQFMIGVVTRDIQFESEFIDLFFEDLDKIDFTDKTTITQRNLNLQKDGQTIQKKLEEKKKA